jgi:hypothetical protein
MRRALFQPPANMRASHMVTHVQQNPIFTCTILNDACATIAARGAVGGTCGVVWLNARA